MACKTFLVFDSKEEAIAYRKSRMTGGWIFAKEQGEAILFPLGFTPTQVMVHPLSNASGELLC